MAPSSDKCIQKLPRWREKKKKKEAKVPQNLLPYILSLFSQFKQTFLSCHKPPWVPPFSCVIDRFRCWATSVEWQLAKSLNKIFVLFFFSSSYFYFQMLSTVLKIYTCYIRFLYPRKLTVKHSFHYTIVLHCLYGCQILVGY